MKTSKFLIPFNLVHTCAAHVWSLILYIICPPQCYSCKAYTPTRVILCSVCENNLDIIAPKMFTINSTYILTVYTLTRYTDPLRPMLFAKYRSDPAVLEKLAELIWQRSVLPHVRVDYLVPIPLHWSRNMKRGFNQAEILANCLSKFSGIPVLHTLKRVRATQYQVRVQHSDRRCNVKNAFEFANQNIDLQGKHVMLVDDSCTTGSTAIEAAKVLTQLQPASITMIVACRAL
jgi:ComF family protein